MIAKTNLVPMGDRILVKPDEFDEILSSVTGQDGKKIEIVASTTGPQEKPTAGTVIAVPDGMSALAKGQRVFFGKYAGYPIDDDKQAFLLIRLDDILAKEKAHGIRGKAKMNASDVT